MWDMIKLYWQSDGTVLKLKGCCGYKGVWLCDDRDHMLPLDEFSDDKYSKDGKQPMCKKCRVPMDADRWGRRPKHQVTGEGKSNWKQRVAKGLGGTPNTPEWQGYLDKAESVWDVEIKNHLLDTAPAQEYFDWVDAQKKPKKSNIAPFFYPPEHEKILKFAGRTVESAIKARKAQKVDGFIYTATHPLWPEIKIGFTFNPPSRLSTFNTCCPHRLFCMPYISTYLKNAKSGEDAIHETLKDFREEGEWFKVSLELATETIEDYIRSLDDDTKEQALG